MSLNLQNKIYGMKFATVLVNAYEKEYGIGEEKFLITDHTKKEIGIPDNFCDDFIKQLTKIGSLQDLKEYFKLENFGGIYQSPIVMRHREIPEIIAHVTIQDRDNWQDLAYTVMSPVNKYYDAMLLFNCFIDVAHEGNVEKEYPEFDALVNGGIGEK